MESLKPFISDVDGAESFKQTILDEIYKLGDPIAMFLVPVCKETFRHTVSSHEGLRCHYSALVMYGTQNRLDNDLYCVYLVNHIQKPKNNISVDTEFVWSFIDFESAVNKVNDLLEIVEESDFLSLEDLDYQNCSWAFLDGEYLAAEIEME